MSSYPTSGASYPHDTTPDAEGQLARLNRMIADLGDAGDQLQERVAPILAPFRPTPTEPANALAVAPVEEVSRLELDLDRLQRKITAIREITDRVIL